MLLGTTSVLTHPNILPGFTSTCKIAAINPYTLKCRDSAMAASFSTLVPATAISAALPSRLLAFFGPACSLVVGRATLAGGYSTGLLTIPLSFSSKLCGSLGWQIPSSLPHLRLHLAGIHRLTAAYSFPSSSLFPEISINVNSERKISVPSGV